MVVIIGIRSFKEEIAMLKKIWFVLHMIIIWCVSMGFYGNKYTNVKNLDNDQNCRVWDRSQRAINKMARFSSDQGNLIYCHGCEDGTVIPNGRNISVPFMVMVEELEGEWLLSCCFTGDDYEDEGVKITRVNRKPYVLWNEWSWDGKTAYSYSNRFMHRLAQKAGLL